LKKIITFGASSSINSINKKLAIYAANQISNSKVIALDLNDFEMPIYSEDRDRIDGIPDKAYEFKKIIKKGDGIIISFAEHNGAYTSAFKNIFDWISRIEKIVWYNKPMFIMSTSDGLRGARLVLEIAHRRISRGNPFNIPIFSLPNFHENFDEKKGIINLELKERFFQELSIFERNL
jgi:NAD(P)H-dependent FMN reductase